MVVWGSRMYMRSSHWNSDCHPRRLGQWILAMWSCFLPDTSLKPGFLPRICSSCRNVYYKPSAGAVCCFFCFFFRDPPGGEKVVGSQVSEKRQNGGHFLGSIFFPSRSRSWREFPNCFLSHRWVKNDDTRGQMSLQWLVKHTKVQWHSGWRAEIRGSGKDIRSRPFKWWG